MDLKLKDEITKLLIANPGMSISDLAKKTGNYYSYTHKVISEMEKKGLVSIKKVMRGKREVTICNLTGDYKHDWVNDFRKVVKSLVKDAEVKAALLLGFTLLALTLFNVLQMPDTYRVASMEALASINQSVDQPAINQTMQEPMLVIIVAFAIVITVLLLIWVFRKKR